MSNPLDRFSEDDFKAAAEVVAAMVGEVSSAHLRSVALNPAEVGFVAGQHAIIEQLQRLASGEPDEQPALTLREFKDNGGFRGGS